MSHSTAPPPHETLKPAAQAWFECLRDQLCAAFEAIEDVRPSDRPAGRFVRNEWLRPGGGGGTIGDAGACSKGWRERLHRVG
jgi:coproporphyrinogen III oxidase